MTGKKIINKRPGGMHPESQNTIGSDKLIICYNEGVFHRTTNRLS